MAITDESPHETERAPQTLPPWAQSARLKGYDLNDLGAAQREWNRKFGDRFWFTIRRPPGLKAMIEFGQNGQTALLVELEIPVTDAELIRAAMARLTERRR
jgi:hypothetical protein